MYYINCYPPIPVINMFNAAEDMTILLALKQTMTIVILLLICYTRILTVFSLAISLLFDILYKLHFDNFLLNEHDDDDRYQKSVYRKVEPCRRVPVCQIS